MGDKNTRWLGGRLITVERAAEPSDIFWENMAINDKTRLKRKIITWLVTLLLLVIVTVITLAINYLVNVLVDQRGHNGKVIDILIYLTSLGKSIIVASINLILRTVMRGLTSKERDKTYTNYNASVTIKLYIAMFINTAIIPYITKFDKNDWFGIGGLVVDIYLIMILINFFNPFFYYFNFTYFMK